MTGPANGLLNVLRAVAVGTASPSGWRKGLLNACPTGVLNVPPTGEANGTLNVAPTATSSGWMTGTGIEARIVRWIGDPIGEEIGRK